MTEPTDALPELEENPELDDKLLKVALTSFANGAMTALSHAGVPEPLAIAAAQVHVHRISNDPIARTVIVTDARLVYEGRMDERRPVRLTVGPCEYHGGGQ